LVYVVTALTALNEDGRKLVDGWSDLSIGGDRGWPVRRAREGFHPAEIPRNIERNATHAQCGAHLVRHLDKTAEPLPRRRGRWP